MSDEYEVESADSGAKDFDFVQTSTMKRGSYIMIKDQPCKVDSVSTSKPGKHGSAKCHLIANQIFTNKKMEEISPAHATVKAPKVKRIEYYLLSVEDGFLELMDQQNDPKNDIRMPEGEHGDKIQGMLDEDKPVMVTVLSACGQEMVVDVKEENTKG